MLHLQAVCLQSLAALRDRCCCCCSVYVAAEEQQLRETLEQLVREETWRPMEDAQQTGVLRSSSELFANVKRSLTRCSRFVTRGAAMLQLGRAFQVGRRAGACGSCRGQVACLAAGKPVGCGAAMLQLGMAYEAKEQCRGLGRHLVDVTMCSCIAAAC